MNESAVGDEQTKRVADIIASVPPAIFTTTFPLQFFKIANDVASIVSADYLGKEGELVFSIVNTAGMISITKLYPHE